jgi:hypothetical protein
MESYQSGEARWITPELLEARTVESRVVVR